MKVIQTKLAETMYCPIMSKEGYRVTCKHHYCMAWEGDKEYGCCLLIPDLQEIPADA